MNRTHSEQARAAARGRAAAIKEKITIPELADIRGADLAGKDGIGQSCDCPACGASRAAGKAVTIGASGDTWGCAVCGASGDVITFEMAATGKDFKGACEDLEALISTPRDAGTGDLFAAGVETQARAGGIVVDLLAFLVLAGSLTAVLLWAFLLFGAGS